MRGCRHRIYIEQDGWAEDGLDWDGLKIASQILSTLLAFAMFYLPVFSLVVIHEFGHLIAGRLCGFQLFTLRIGPIEVIYPFAKSEPYAKSETERVTWQWHWGLSYLWTGSIRMRATESSLTRVRTRFAIYLAGGIVANLGSGLLALPIAFHDSELGGIAKYFVTGSFLIGIVNLIPHRARLFDSDGKVLWALLFVRESQDVKLYWFTLLARINEVTRLSREGHATEARERAEALVRASYALPAEQITEEHRMHLGKFERAFCRPQATADSGEECTESMDVEAPDSISG